MARLESKVDSLLSALRGFAATPPARSEAHLEDAETERRVFAPAAVAGEAEPAAAKEAGAEEAEKPRAAATIVTAPAALAARGADAQQRPLPAAFAAPSAADVQRLGTILVIGAGRAIGSAVAGLLASTGGVGADGIHAVEDGTTGFVTAVPYDIPLYELDVTKAGSMVGVFARAPHAQRAPHRFGTVFVDADASATRVAPWDAPLACVLTEPAYGVAHHVARVVFLQAGDFGSGQSAADVLASCAPPPADPLRNREQTAAAEAATDGSSPSVAVVHWPDALVVGPAADPTVSLSSIPGGASGLSSAAPGGGGALQSYLACLAAHADGRNHEDGYDVARVLATFFAAASSAASGGTAASSACGAQLGAALQEAALRSLASINAAADAVTAAVGLTKEAPQNAAGAPLTVHIFTRKISSLKGAGSVPVAGASLARNGLLTLQDLSGGNGHAEASGALERAVAAALPAAGKAGAAWLCDSFWWIFRHGLLRGYRLPEPLPVYDPAVVVSGAHGAAVQPAQQGNAATGAFAARRYSVHDLATFGVSHASGHHKMRHCQAIWGWRFKRGGIPWSSSAHDPLVPVKAIEPPEGSRYDLLALRTVAVWKWVVTTYLPLEPRSGLADASIATETSLSSVGPVLPAGYAWYTRMWDDVLPLVERYVDIASAHDGAGKLAVGRVIGDRTQYLSGGPPGLFSSGWASIMRGGADRCLGLFQDFAAGRPQNPPVQTHCGLGCEDLVIEWCLRDVVGGYWEAVHWWGLEALSSVTINEHALYNCKALACRRRVISRGDPNDRNPIQSVVYHYVKPDEMKRAEPELYGLPPGSPAWRQMCEAAQNNPECQDDVIRMPLP